MAPDETAPQSIPKHVQAMETSLRLIEAAARAAADAPATLADLRPLARALERAIGSTLDAYDLRREPTTALLDAMQACDDAVAALEEATKLDEAMSTVTPWVRAARQWLHVPHAAFASMRTPSPPARELVVALTVPTLHRVERPSLAPSVRVATPIEPPPLRKTLADELQELPPNERLPVLRARSKEMREAAARRRDEARAAREARMERRKEQPDVVPGFTPGPHARATPDEARQATARTLFEDVCAVGMQRTPLLGEHWRDTATYDERLLRDVDALAGLGPVALAELERLVVDSPAKDASRAFGIAFCLGCFEGRDALAAVERCIRLLGPSSPDTCAAAAMALKLAPHPDLATTLRAWLTDPEAGLRRVAIDVLCHRGLATPDEIGARCRDEAPEVAAIAFVAAGLAALPELSVLVEERAAPEDPELADAVAWASLLGGVSHAVERVKRAFDRGGRDTLLLLVALAGERDDVADLVSRWERAPSRALASALGYGGHPASLGPLIDALEADTAPELKQEIAFALQRITGAEMYEDIDLPPEKLDVDDPPMPQVPDDAPPVKRLASDRRDRPSDGAPDRVRVPTQRAEAWRAFLNEEPSRWEGERRLRRGQPYTPALSFAELEGYQVTPAERRVLYRELILKTGRAVPFDPVDMVPVQELALKKLAPIVEKAGSAPGAWGRALRQGGMSK